MNDALSALARLLKVQPEFLGTHRLSPRWLDATEAGVVGSAAFHIVTSGTCTVEMTASDRTIVLHTGALILMPRGADHRIREAHAKLSIPSEVICGRLAFETPYHNLVLAALPDVIVIAAADGPEAARVCLLMQTIAAELNCSRQGASAIVNVLGTALLVMIMRMYLEQENVRTGLLSLLAHRQASRALAAMLENMGHDWSLDELATRAHASRASLVRMFKKQVQQAPLEFLLGLRMETAWSKLSGTPETLGNIAAEVGFRSESAFSRAFRRRFGIPPGEARDRMARQAAA
jgi:AraC family transcriptional activator of mtrCDE